LAVDFAAASPSKVRIEYIENQRPFAEAQLMIAIALDQAQAKLPELIHSLQPGNDVLITEGDKTVARLVAEPAGTPKPRQPGSAIGILTIVSEDAEHLEDFREYME
jgi:antitoxin (DNA-binding transcriptional repressor) of toxin-antitoxin stability system